MVVEIKRQDYKETVFSIDEPGRYGPPSVYEKRRVFEEKTVPHDPQYRSQLPKISRREIQSLPNNKDYHQEAQTFEVPQVGTLVFIQHHDTDTSSATYRKGAHTIEGPFILVDF